MIPHSFLQTLLERVDIVEVVGRYVQLKKAGANFSGLCPFHNEKSPSFTVSQTKQFYHCFGCGAHGTAIGFLMEHAGLPFPDAVEELARGAGLTVPHEPGSRGGTEGFGGSAGYTRRRPDESAGSGAQAAPGEGNGEGAGREASGDGNAKAGGANLPPGRWALEAMQRACDFYRRALRQAPDAIAYLKGRGLSGEVAARFGMGYAPDGWQSLADVFDDYSDPMLSDVGLVIAGEKRRYDRFRERIMFPIRNVRGHVIGFGGRILTQGEPKYLNSPETPLFVKGNELYGLFEARLAIREQGFVLVVEGYMDVVALAQMGFANAVATLGTACTPVHVQKLVRQTEKIVFSFDGDAAGVRAARRALEASLPYAADNRQLAFLFLPAEHDPDSFIRAHGQEGFAEAVARAMPLSEFLLAQIFTGKDLALPEGRAKALFDAKPLIQAIPANALRVQLLHAIADRLAVAVSEVAALCGVDGRVAAARRPARPIAERRRVTGSERRALRNLVMHPRLATDLTAAELEVIEQCAQHRALFDEVVAHGQALGARASFRLLMDVLKNSDNALIFEEIQQEILSLDENVRDLLMSPHAESGGASGADNALTQRQQLETEAYEAHLALIGQEISAALAQMRYESINARLDALFKLPQRTPEESEEAAALLRLRAELKQPPAPQGV